MALSEHQELAIFFVTTLSEDHPIILGLPRLRRHNPYIDWSNLEVMFTSGYCQTFCYPEGMPQPKALTLPDTVN